MINEIEYFAESYFLLSNPGMDLLVDGLEVRKRFYRSGLQDVNNISFVLDNSGLPPRRIRMLTEMVRKTFLDV